MNTIKSNVMIKEWIENTISNFWVFLTGVLGSLFAYFLPIKDVVNYMVLFFIIDVLVGYWTARKIRGERFKASKIWEATIPRMLLSIILIMGAYIWENVYYGVAGNTYKIIGGFISGILLVSIAQNGYKLTKWNVFISIVDIIENRFKNEKKTGNKNMDNE